jgi:hypothetical protein
MAPDDVHHKTQLWNSAHAARALRASHPGARGAPQSRSARQTPSIGARAADASGAPRRASVDCAVEAFSVLVPGSDFKSDGSCGDATSAGSIPVRLRRASLGSALCLLAAVPLGVACVATTDYGSAPAARDAPGTSPAWILDDCRTHWPAGSRRVLCAVGSAGGSENQALVRATATARAWAALDTSLDKAVEAMLLDYASTQPGRRDFDLARDGKQHIARAARKVTDAALAKASLREAWHSPADVDYVLVALDADAFSSAVREMTQLLPSLRQALLERADAAFAAR